MILQDFSFCISWIQVINATLHGAINKIFFFRRKRRTPFLRMGKMIIIVSVQKVATMNHLTKEQRYTIFCMLKAKCNQKEIAKMIGVHKSTISRELKRNQDFRNGKYSYDLAQRKYENRMREKPKHKHFTLEVEEYVVSKLKDDYSPEQISGTAKVEGERCVSHETIYQYVWKNKKQGGELYKHLRNKGRKYRKRGSLKDSRGQIKDRVDISERPDIVNQKVRIGDFEIDTIIGKNHKGAILTMNDRCSSYCLLRLLSGKNAEELADQAIKALTPLLEIGKTITADNGKEFAAHKRISEETGMDFYFATPYHSWERGANENMNGLIRQYFPKGSSFEDVKPEDVLRVQEKLNNRPRKKLGYKTPNKVFFDNFENSKVAFMT